MTHPKTKLPAGGVTRRNGGGYFPIAGVTPGKVGSKTVHVYGVPKRIIIWWLRFVLHGYLTLGFRGDAIPSCVFHTVGSPPLLTLAGAP